MNSQQNLDETKTMGMSRGFLGRAIALGLFVTVGTFAVTHSLSRPKILARHDTAEAQDGEAQPLAESADAHSAVVANIPTDTAPSPTPSSTIQSVQAGDSVPIIKASAVSPASEGSFEASNSPAKNPIVNVSRKTAEGSGPPAETASKSQDEDKPPSSVFANVTDNRLRSAPSGDESASSGPPTQKVQPNPSSGSAPSLPAGGGFEPPPSRTFEPKPSTQDNLPTESKQSPPPLTVSAPQLAQPAESRFSPPSATPVLPPVKSFASPQESPSAKEQTLPKDENQASPSSNIGKPQTSASIGDNAASSPAGGGVSQGGFSLPPQAALPPAGTMNSSAGDSLEGKRFGDIVSPTPANSVPSAPPQIQYPTQIPQPKDTGGNGFVASSPPTASEPASRSVPLVPPPRSEPAANLPAIPASSGLETRPAINVLPAATRGTPGEAALEGLQRPSLTIEKVAPAEIQVHQNAKFKLVVRNVGQAAAAEVVVTDQIPSGAEFVNATPAATHRTSDGKVQWVLGQLAPGEERSLELELRPTRPGEIGSVAQVTFSTQASARTRVTRPELSVEHFGPAKVLIGNQATLRFVVHNRGDGPATDVLLLERVPSQLKFNDEFRDLEYPIGTIPPGKSKEISLSLTAVEAGKFENLVMVTGGGGLEARHRIEMEVVAPKLDGQITGPSRRFLKREAAHTYSVGNSGTAPATNVDIVARLPRGVQFVSANNRGQYDPGSHSVYWSLAELSPGQSASVALTTLPIETGTHEIEFRTSADLKQNISNRQTLTIEHLVDVFFDIRDTTDPIEVGGNTSYRIRIVNQGTKPATEVRLEVQMADGVRPVRVDGDVRHDIQGQTVMFAPITSINPGEEIVLDIEAVGTAAGEHRVSANLHTRERDVNLTKQESTRVYADR